MRRRLLNLLTLLSLALFASACVAWARSYFKTDAVQISKGEVQGSWYTSEGYQAASRRGGLMLGWRRSGGDMGMQSNVDALRRRERCDGTWHVDALPGTAGPLYGDGSLHRRTRLGFGVNRADWVKTGYPPWSETSWVVVVPWPAAVVLLGAVPAARGAIAWWRRKRRRQAGRCARCGYDLRASPERCPECGRGVATLGAG
jgi:hypothetical protein